MRNSSFYAYSTSFKFDLKKKKKASNEKILFYIFYIFLHVE